MEPRAKSSAGADASKPARPAAGSEPRLRLRVTVAAESAIRSGHPWVFADSVREQNRAGRAGELAVIYDKRDRFLAVGLFDPDSPLRVRVLHTGQPAAIDAAWWRGRLERAIAQRRGLFDDQTTGYRWVHGENDGWPGLVLDRYGATLVMKLYTAAWLPRIEEVSALVRASLQPERLVLRLSRNIQEKADREFGWKDGVTIRIAATEQKPGERSGPTQGVTTHDGSGAGTPVNGGAGTSAPRQDEPPSATFLESGLRFEADVVRGQKTGFFLDQRENRRLVETLAAGREVLNAFSFSGGFSLYAARGGARSVADLDLSGHALESARRNVALNAAIEGVAACRHETAQAEAFEWLAADTARKFDLIILDPPSLAKRETERAGAIKAYGRLTALGLGRLRRDSWLVAASCSAHVSEEEFFEAVRQAARRSGRRFSEWRTTAHPPDHPATFPEAKYLKCIYLKVAG